MVAPTFGFPQLTGMSFLFRKSVLESIGGLRQLLNRAAEDALLGMIFAENGYKVEYASLTAQQNPEPGPLAKFYARHKRYLKHHTCTSLINGLLQPHTKGIEFPERKPSRF